MLKIQLPVLTAQQPVPGDENFSSFPYAALGRFLFFPGLHLVGELRVLCKVPVEFCREMQCTWKSRNQIGHVPQWVRSKG